MQMDSGSQYSSQSSLQGGGPAAPAPAASGAPPPPGPGGNRSAGMDEIIRESEKTGQSLNTLEAEIWKAEEDYFDVTAHGNIVRGWDGFLDSKPPPKRLYQDKERVFSWSSFHYWSKNRQHIERVQSQETEEMKRNRSFASSPRENKAFFKKRKRKRTGGDVSDDEE